MWNFLKTRGVDLAITTIALTALMIDPAWAQNGPPCQPFPACDLPGPAGGILAGGAILGAIVIAKWWRRR